MRFDLLMPKNYPSETFTIQKTYPDIFFIDLDKSVMKFLYEPFKEANKDNSNKI